MSSAEETAGREAAAGAIASPVQSIEAINKAVATLFTYKRPGSYKDIAAAVGMHPVTVSQALSGSRDLGLTQLAGKRGLYVLTKDGQEYARLVTAGKVRESQAYLNRVIQSNPMWDEIVSFLKATKGQKRDPMDIVLDVERKLGKQWSKTMRQSVKDGYLSVLTYTQLAKKEGDGIVSVIEEIPLVPEAGGEAGVQATATTMATSPESKPGFARLQSEDFLFEVRKDPSVIGFVRSQFEPWLNYVESVAKAEKEKKEK